jgi:hypothetical protein
VNEGIRLKANIGDSVREVEMLQSPRCIKSHLPLQLLPEQLWTVRPKVNAKLLKLHILPNSETAQINPLKPKLIQIIFKNSVRTAKKTRLFTITKIN